MQTVAIVASVILVLICAINLLICVPRIYTVINHIGRNLATVVSEGGAERSRSEYMSSLKYCCAAIMALHEYITRVIISVVVLCIWAVMVFILG